MGCDKLPGVHIGQRGRFVGQALIKVANALARFAERAGDAAFRETDDVRRNAYRLESFRQYAAAAERARIEEWPDEAYRNWRHQRASLARVLAGEGMMWDVADIYDDVRKQYAPQRAMRDRLLSLVRGDEL